MFHGSIVALVTPFTAKGDVDINALDSLIHMHLQAKTDGIVVLGSTGEAPTINLNERKRIIKHTVEQVKEQCPVVVGTGTNCTRASIQLTEVAMHAGADAALLVVPYYNKPPQAGIVAHFKQIADAVPLPQILYNNPSRTGVDISLDSMKILCKIPNIVAIKEASGDLSVERLVDLQYACQDELDYLAGEDSISCEFMLKGGKGVISASANIAPEMMHKLWAHIKANEVDQALDLNKSLMKLHNALGVQVNPIPIKWALSRMGKLDNVLRSPLFPLEESYISKIESTLFSLGLVT